MNKKKHPLECPKCEKFLCKCRRGNAADEEQSKTDNDDDIEQQRSQGVVIKPDITEGESMRVTLLNQKSQLLSCTLFALKAEQSSPELSDELSEDQNNDLNTGSVSFSMGMRMGGSSE